MRRIDVLLESRTAGEWTVLEVKGEVDMHTASRLREGILGLIEEGARRIVVDLQGVDFMDSTGLGALVTGSKRLGERQGSMRLVCSRDPVLKLLTIAGLDERLPIYATVAEAVAV